MHKQIIIVLICLFSINVHCVWGQIVVNMEKENNIFYLPCKINGLALKVIFDTGASNCSLSMTEAAFMLKNGYLQESDFKGLSYSQIASGEIVEDISVNLREVEIGGIKLNNISATISKNLNAPLLLGQSAIQKLGPIQLNNNQLIINNGYDSNLDADTYQSYQKAFQLNESGEFRDAIFVSFQALSSTSNPKLRSLLYDNLAYSYFHTGYKKEAIEMENKALGENAMNKQAAYNLGVYLFELNDYDKALQAFKQYIYKFEKENDREYLPAVYAYLGDTQKNLGQVKEAEESFFKSLSLSPSSQVYYGIADLEMSKNDYVKASEYYTKGIEYEPNRPSNIQRYYQLGLAYYNNKQYDKARNAFLKSAQLMQEYGEQLRSAISSNDKEGNERYMELAWYAFNSDLWIARLTNTPNEMIAYYNKVINVPTVKDNLVAYDYVRLSNAYNTLNDKISEKEIITKGYKIFPESVDIMFKLSWLTDDENAKIDLLKKILTYENQKRPIIFDYATVYNNIAWSYCVLKKYTEGLPFAEIAVKRNPEHDYSWETLGELYYFLERYNDCVNAMTRCLAIKNCKSRKSALSFRGKALIKLKKEELGKKDLEEAAKVVNNIIQN